MNRKLGTTILIVACIGLAIALVVVKTQVDGERKKAEDTILDFSNQLDKANIGLNDLRQVNITLTSDLATNREAMTSLSNQLDETSSALATSQTSLQSAQQQITNLNTRVSDLEVQNQTLDQRASSLSNQISGLNVQIASTQAQLTEAKTNNAFLENELKRQVAEKAALETKFNDLKQVRDQEHKLKIDALIARRLEWIHEGTDPSQQMKGGQLLMQHNASSETSSRPNNSLNVEVESGGTIRVLPSPTNSPPQ